MVINGAEANAKINGIYLMTVETYNGKPAYRMEGYPDSWLVFSSLAKWIVTHTKGKEENDGSGFCLCVDAVADNPSLVKLWAIATITHWQPQPGVSCTALVSCRIRQSVTDIARQSFSN